MNQQYLKRLNGLRNFDLFRLIHQLNVQGICRVNLLRKYGVYTNLPIAGLILAIVIEHWLYL